MLGIFKKAWNTTQLNDLLALIGSSFLTVANAASTYLTQANAASTYLSKADAVTDYVAKNYLEYMAVISQSGTNAPNVVTEVINDFSTPTPVYGSQGVYSFIFAGELGGKIGVMISLGAGTVGFPSAAYASDGTTVIIRTNDSLNNPANDILTSATIYLRMYP